MKRTALYERHVAAGARMVPFGGWDMPLHYGSQIEEHHVVRRAAGVFDVSHMTVVDVDGAGAKDFLRRLLANDVGRLTPGQALYSCMLDEQGGILDDLIAYRRTTEPLAYRVIVNAATRDKDLQWMNEVLRSFDASLQLREDLLMLAVQGPEACRLAAPLLPTLLAEESLALGVFHAAEGHGWFVARTGYTGEDGWEMLLPVAEGLHFFDALIAAGVKPCGLGARDTLRLEAGMNLYGQDMDESTSPLVSGLAWTVAWEPAGRSFIGREALERERAAGVQHQFTGLLLEAPGVMRHGQRVLTSAGDGIITSGGFSPTMNRSIALARVPAAAGADAQVDIRGALRPVRLVRAPFVRRGRVLTA